MEKFLAMLLVFMLCLPTWALAMEVQPPTGKQSTAQDKTHGSREQAQSDYQQKADQASQIEKERQLKQARQSAEAFKQALEQAQDPAVTLDSFCRAAMLCQSAQDDLTSGGKLAYDLVAETADYFELSFEGDPYEGALSPDQETPWNAEWTLPGGVYVEFLLKNMPNAAGEIELIVWEMNIAMETAEERICLQAYVHEGLIFDWTMDSVVSFYDMTP